MSRAPSPAAVLRECRRLAALRGWRVRREPFDGSHTLGGWLVLAGPRGPVLAGPLALPDLARWLRAECQRLQIK